jgi:hypothetical protein
MRLTIDIPPSVPDPNGGRTGRASATRPSAGFSNAYMISMRTCRECGLTVRRPADEALVAVLDAAGVTALRSV